MSMHELKSSLLSGGGSVSLELGVDKGESLELVLVQVLNHFLIGRGQHRRVACEKAVKVLRIPSALLRRAGRNGVQRGGGGSWMEGKGKGRVGRCTGMDGVGVEEGGVGVRRRKTKEGQWRVESGCEMTSLEHGFKYRNKVPNLGVPELNGPLAGQDESGTRLGDVLLSFSDI